MKVAVVGAGLVGAAIADRLALAGARVTVVDRAAPGAGASGMSFGWINAAFAETDAYYRLRRRAIDAFRTLDGEMDLGMAVSWSGCLWWEDEGPDFDAHRAELNRRGYAVRMVDRDQFSKLEPSVANSPERALLSETEGAAEADQVAIALLRRASGNGASVLLGREVVGIWHEAGAVRGLETDLGRLSADVVVCAAGAWSRSLLSGTGVDLPMDNKPGLILQTAPVAPVVRHTIMSPDIHFRQAVDGRIILGEIFSGGFGEETLDNATALTAELMARLSRRLPATSGLPVERTLLGTRPVPKDGLPVIGFADGPGGLYLAVMHSGVTLGPLVGQLAAAEIMGGKDDVALRPFRPARFDRRERQTP